MSGYFWSQGYKHLANSWNQLDRYIICKHLTTAQQHKEFGRTIKFLLASGAASASCDSISANLANYQLLWSENWRQENRNYRDQGLQPTDLKAVVVSLVRFEIWINHESGTTNPSLPRPLFRFRGLVKPSNWEQREHRRCRQTKVWQRSSSACIFVLTCKGKSTEDQTVEHIMIAHLKIWRPGGMRSARERSCRYDLALTCTFCTALEMSEHLLLPRCP